MRCGQPDRKPWSCLFLFFFWGMKLREVVEMRVRMGSDMAGLCVCVCDYGMKRMRREWNVKTLCGPTLAFI